MTSAVSHPTALTNCLKIVLMQPGALRRKVPRWVAGRVDDLNGWSTKKEAIGMLLLRVQFVSLVSSI